MAKLKVVSLDGGDFLNLFKKKIAAPLKSKLAKIVWPKIAELLEALEHELPMLLYGWITFEESNRSASGAEKYSGVLLKFSKWATLKGYGAFLPVLLPMIESAVRMIYKGKVESVFDKLGIEDAFEKWLGIDIGSEEKAHTPAATPAPAPAK